MNPLLLMAAAGGLLGMLDKQGTLANVPKLPFLGEHGTIALAAFLLPGAIPRAVMQGALFLSARELVMQGHISGDDAPCGIY
jgi:hypothetical protein